jgi:hypothetical protein
MGSSISYARCCAARTLSPSAVTHSTRPPAVSSAPPCSSVPAWNTTASALLAGTPVITSPLRGSSG